MQSIFYNTNHLEFENKKRLLNESYIISKKSYVNILDCNLSLARKSTGFTYEDVIKIFDNKSHLTVIERPNLTENKYGEIAFSTSNINNPHYFLYLILDLEDLNKIIKQFNLKIKN